MTTTRRDAAATALLSLSLCGALSELFNGPSHATPSLEMAAAAAVAAAVSEIGMEEEEEEEEEEERTGEGRPRHRADGRTVQTP